MCGGWNTIAAALGGSLIILTPFCRRYTLETRPRARRGEPNQSSGEDRGRVGAGRPRRSSCSSISVGIEGQVEVAVLPH